MLDINQLIHDHKKWLKKLYSVEFNTFKSKWNITGVYLCNDGVLVCFYEKNNSICGKTFRNLTKMENKLLYDLIIKDFLIENNLKLIYTSISTAISKLY